MSEIQRSKEYNSKTGKWEMMSFKVNKKGDVSVAPKRKEIAKKMVARSKEDWKKAGPFKNAADAIRDPNFSKIHKAIRDSKK